MVNDGPRRSGWNAASAEMVADEVGHRTACTHGVCESGADNMKNRPVAEVVLAREESSRGEERNMSEKNNDENVKGREGAVEGCPNCGKNEWTAPDAKGEVVCDDAVGGCGLVKRENMDNNNPGDWGVGDGTTNPGRERPVRTTVPGIDEAAATLTVKQSVKRFGQKDYRGARLNAYGHRVKRGSERNERSPGDRYRAKMVRNATAEVGSKHGRMMSAFGCILMDAYKPQSDEKSELRLGKLPLNQTRHMQKVESRGWKPPGGYQERVSTTAALIIAGRIVGGGYDATRVVRRHALVKKHIWNEVKNITRRIGRLSRLGRNRSSGRFAAMKTRRPEQEIAINHVANFMDDEQPQDRLTVERVIRLCMIEVGALSPADSARIQRLKPRALIGVFALLEFERLGIGRAKSGLSRAIDFSVTQMRNTLKSYGDLLQRVHSDAVSEATA